MNAAEITNLTETWIRDHCKPRIYNRGKSYRDEDRVESVRLIEDHLEAEVRGTSLEPYRVTVHLEGQSIKRVECTCPTSIPGICKHAVAALLYCLEEPDKFSE